MKHLQPFFVQTPNESQFTALASRFKQLHGISCVIEAIDVSRIYVLAPIVGGKSYYCIGINNVVDSLSGMLSMFTRPWNSSPKFVLISRIMVDIYTL